MSFKFYKFCQNWIITVVTAVFSMFYTLSLSGTIPWWLGIILSVVATIIALVPPLGIFYPLTFGVFILVALIRAYLRSSLFFWVLLILLLLHIIRNVAILTFARSNPEKSLQYDEAIRFGINLNQ